MFMMASVTQLPLKSCDGGHICLPPKECCKQGCCYPPIAPVSFRTPTLPTTGMLNPIFLGHWYFWAAVTATVAGILCACSLWRRHSQRGCCGTSERDDRASEPDSNGSCYAPPHYSRCNSFHQAPPPYSEVTSKPDLYPLVISFNGYNLEPHQKVRRCGTGYLMVQYFRNYIVRPVGTLSTTSTMDSLGSSFLCNAINDANTIIPPPYSCTGSLEEVNTNSESNARSSTEFPRSISSATCNDFHLAQHSPSSCSQNGNIVSTNSFVKGPRSNNNEVNQNCNDNNNKEVSITTNPCYMKNAGQAFQNVSDSMLVTKTTDILSDNTCSGRILQTDCDQSTTNYRAIRKLNRESAIHDYNIVDSESQEDEHNFSDLLNLSVCIPSTITQLPLGMTTSNSQSHDSHQYSVVNSITSSDISSLANLGTPDSPPRATSPTAEIRELLDKIQQLPQHKSPVPINNTENNREPKSKFLYRSKATTMYMPLNLDPLYSGQSKISPDGKSGRFGKTARSWLSRSAPNTPCGNYVPSFPTTKKYGKSNSRGRICDGSPLLYETEETDDEIQRPQYS